MEAVTVAEAGLEKAAEMGSVKAVLAEEGSEKAVAVDSSIL